jgi:hypothetical protein
VCGQAAELLNGAYARAGMFFGEPLRDDSLRTDGSSNGYWAGGKPLSHEVEHGDLRELRQVCLVLGQPALVGTDAHVHVANPDAGESLGVGDARMGAGVGEFHREAGNAGRRQRAARSWGHANDASTVNVASFDDLVMIVVVLHA